MKSAEEVLAYLNYQFPATKGHVPLRQMLVDLEISGMKKAADTVRVEPIYGPYFAKLILSAIAELRSKRNENRARS